MMPLLWVLLWTTSCAHKAPDPPRVLIVQAGDHLVKVLPGQTIQAQRSGWFLSDELLSQLLERLRAMKAALEGLPGT